MSPQLTNAAEQMQQLYSTTALYCNLKLLLSIGGDNKKYAHVEMRLLHIHGDLIMIYLRRSLGWALKAHLRGQTNENLKGRAEVGMLSTRRAKGWHGQAPDAVARAWYEGDPVSRARTDLLRQIPLRPQMPGFNKGCG